MGRNGPFHREFVNSCTIILTDASAEARAILDRMPVLLDKADIVRWLDGPAWSF
jgi:putative SOS response-associated peptidase YedK